MKKLRSVLCLALILVSVVSSGALAATFSFFFSNTGTDYSILAEKTNGKSFATVQVTSAPSSATYKYAVATGIYTGYKTSWKNKTGTGTFDISYNSKPSDGTDLRLHGATVSNSGTSTVSGAWTP